MGWQSSNGQPAILLGSVKLQDAVSAALATVTNAQDGYGSGNNLFTESIAVVFDGLLHQRQRMASAANLIAESGLGVGLIAPPGSWGVTSAPAAATQASASRAAGGAGVRHIAWDYSFSLIESGAPGAATTVDFVPRDGATGVGALLDVVSFSFPAVAGGSAAPITKSGINRPGTAATAMTFEGTAAGAANTVERAAGGGYDVS